MVAWSLVAPLSALPGSRSPEADPVFAKLQNPRHGHLCRPAGGLRLGRLQPHPLYLLHHLDHRAALHREQPRDPHVFPAARVLRDHTGGCRLAAAALCWDFHSHHHVEEPEVCEEIGLKVPRWGTQHSRGTLQWQWVPPDNQVREGTVEWKPPTSSAWPSCSHRFLHVMDQRDRKYLFEKLQNIVSCTCPSGYV